MGRGTKSQSRPIGRRCSFGVEPGPPAHARLSPTVADAPGPRRCLRQPARSASIGWRRTGPGNTSRPSAHTPSCATWLKSSLASGSGHDSSENSPLAPPFAATAAGWYQSAVHRCRGVCHPSSARRAAPRAGRRHVAARLPACSGSIVARRHRRVVASTMAAHRCTSTPIEVVGAPGGAVVLQQRRRGLPAGACGLPLASRCRSEVRGATPRHHDTLGRDDLGFQDSEGTASKSGHSSQSLLQIREHVRTTSSTRTGLKKDVGKTSKVVALKEKTSKVGTILQMVPTPLLEYYVPLIIRGCLCVRYAGQSHL